MFFQYVHSYYKSPLDLLHFSSPSALVSQFSIQCQWNYILRQQWVIGMLSDLKIETILSLSKPVAECNFQPLLAADIKMKPDERLTLVLSKKYCPWKLHLSVSAILFLLNAFLSPRWFWFFYLPHYKHTGFPCLICPPCTTAPCKLQQT